MCNREWQFYLKQSVVVLRKTVSGRFTYNTGWQFYVFHAERLILRYPLNRRLCGSYRQSGGLEERFDTFRLQN
jgi:hypothetical protein